MAKHQQIVIHAVAIIYHHIISSTEVSASMLWRYTIKHNCYNSMSSRELSEEFYETMLWLHDISVTTLSLAQKCLYDLGYAIVTLLTCYPTNHFYDNNFITFSTRFQHEAGGRILLDLASPCPSAMAIRTWLWYIWTLTKYNHPCKKYKEIRCNTLR